MGVNGNVTAVIGAKKLLSGGNPVQPVKVHAPENRGAFARLNCCEPSINGVPIPGDPFRSDSTAMACPSRS